MSDRLDSLVQAEKFVFFFKGCQKRANPAAGNVREKSPHSVNNESLHANTHHLYFPRRRKKRCNFLLTKMSYFSCLFFCLCLPPFPPPKKIDEENEANLLAVLTETLDSIPVDEDGLPSFEALADGDVTNASDRSCPSSPDGSPRTPEPEEPSLVRPTTSSSFANVSHHSGVETGRDHWPCACCRVLPVHGRHQIRVFNKTGHQKCPFACHCLHLAASSQHAAAFATIWSLYM